MRKVTIEYRSNNDQHIVEEWRKLKQKVGDTIMSLPEFTYKFDTYIKDLEGTSVGKPTTPAQMTQYLEYGIFKEKFQVVVHNYLQLPLTEKNFAACREELFVLDKKVNNASYGPKKQKKVVDNNKNYQGNVE
jgi:hypothetical protein